MGDDAQPVEPEVNGNAVCVGQQDATESGPAVPTVDEQEVEFRLGVTATGRPEQTVEARDLAVPDDDAGQAPTGGGAPAGRKS